jgi:hypothetical protein
MPKQWEEMTQAGKFEELRNDVKRISDLLNQFQAVIRRWNQTQHLGLPRLNKERISLAKWWSVWLGASRRPNDRWVYFDFCFSEGLSVSLATSVQPTSEDRNPCGRRFRSPASA